MDKLPPHPLTAEAGRYIATLDARGKELHELAIEKLGSSYFVDRTLGFQKWKAAAAVGAVGAVKEKK